jgi:hypothetical protein
MKRFPHRNLALLLGAAILGAVSLILVMVGTGPKIGKKAAEAKAAPSLEAPVGPITRPVDSSPSPVERPVAGSPGSTSGDPPSVQWEERIQNILADQSVSVEQASRRLLAMAGDSAGPETQRVDALLHGLNLISDSDYLQEALPLFTRIDLPRGMNEIVLSDLYNRQPEISLPAAKAIGAVTGHPLAESARELVDFFVQASES